MSSILVLGAGELGLSILRALSAHTPSPRLSVLVRPNTLSTASPRRDLLQSLPATLVAADLAGISAADLTALFRPFDTIIAANGASSASSLLKVAQCVLDAGVRRFFPWQFGVDYDVVGLGSPAQIWDTQLRVRELLRGQRQTEWVIVSTGLFMSMLFLKEFGLVDAGLEGEEGKGGVARALKSWETRITTTDVDDIGKCMADILFETDPRVVDRVVYLGGSTITYGELADTVERVLGREVQRECWTVEHLRQDMERDGNEITRYRAAFARETGVAWDLEVTWNAKRGIKMMSVEEYAKGLFLMK